MERAIRLSYFQTLLRGCTVDQWVPISHIEDNIYLGGIPLPLNDERVSYIPPHNPLFYIHSLGVGAVLSLTDYDPCWNLGPDVEHRGLVIVDVAQSNISDYFDELTSWMRDVIYRGKIVFVHCHMGISRSTSILAAYYLRYGLPGSTENGKRPTLEEVMTFIKSRRPQISPNLGFISQLLDYEAHLKN
jgi:hypothetical protein